MPVDSMIVAAAVVLMFSTFGLVMAWADRQTRDLHRAATVPAHPRSPAISLVKA